jgi:hypothetical protein
MVLEFELRFSEVLDYLRPASSPLPALALVIFSGIVSHFSFSG